MQKVCYTDHNPGGVTWDDMWTKRTIEDELASCEIETPPKDLFQCHLPNGATIIDAGCGFGKWVVYLKRRGHRVVGLDNNEYANGSKIMV